LNRKSKQKRKREEREKKEKRKRILAFLHFEMENGKNFVAKSECGTLPK